MTAFLVFIITPRGIRIPVTSVKGKCPRPLDDGGTFYIIILQCNLSIVNNIILNLNF